MKHLFYALILSGTVAANCHAQTGTPDELLNKGITLYDAGDYKAAIEQYQLALKQDAKNPAVNYELSLTYFALQDMPNTIRYSDAVIKLGKASPVIKAQAMVNKGSALDIIGKPTQAIKEFRNAIQLDPSYQMAYYNLGLTLFNQRKLSEAAETLEEAVKLNPGHASSHLLLAYTKQDQKLRVQSQLAFYNFLLLDPASERAATAFQEMQRMQKEGLSKGDNNAITISVSADKLANNSFSAADLMLSMMQVSNEMESHEGKTPEELFYSNTTSFFNVLGELRKKQRDFWWSYYVAFFDDMNTQGHTEAFCYYIGQSEAAKQWVIQHPEKVMALGNWYKAYKR